MIKKIISGGQTGADQAAIDVAINMGIPYGGRLPKGRKTEKGPLPDKYLLQELPDSSYSKRTKKNVVGSDGTLIISHGKLTGGSELTRIIAEKNDRPCLHIDLNKIIVFKAAEQIKSWIETHKIEVLNIAGPRESNDPKIYKAARDVLETVLHLDIIDSSMSDPFSTFNSHSLSTSNLPRTVDGAVNMLLSELSFKEKTRLANMPEKKLIDLRLSLGL
ncbi:MAG: putative molybdenum carrier protein, partial [Deltaproteobacteria bacterium]|nr:putative molybdenum carrier protein [Deltaproteobacteria bacterium]